MITATSRSSRSSRCSWEVRREEEFTLSQLPFCSRCQTIILDGWPCVALLSRPGERAVVRPLCLECADLVEAATRPQSGSLRGVEVTLPA